MTTSTSERPDTGPGDRYSTRDVNSMPPLRRAIPLGIQHVLAMFVSNVTVPIIIAGAADLPPDQTAFMVQAAMFVAGIATLLQSLGLGPIGARLPIVMGTSFGFVPVLIPIAIGMGLPAALGAALCGGVAMALMGLFLPWFRFLFPPVVTGTFAVMLGSLLMPVGLSHAGGGLGVMVVDHPAANYVPPAEMAAHSAAVGDIYQHQDHHQCQRGLFQQLFGHCQPLSDQLLRIVVSCRERLRGTSCHHRPRRRPEWPLWLLCVRDRTSPDPP